MALLSLPSSITIGGRSLPAPAAFGLAAGLAGLVLYLVWLALLPKPIPGIPYHTRSARRIFGDIPDLAKAMGRRDWFALQSTELGSPIFQLFIRPFSTPWVVIADFRESQDILLRRGKEFDRSYRNYEGFGGVVPNHHITMRTADPRFKGNKELVKDLMTPQFLSEVSAPQIYEALTSVVKLWRTKATIANGRPFEAAQDFYQAALDIIMAVAFDVPENESMMHRQLEHLASHPPPPDSGGSETPVPFSHAAVRAELQAAIILVESLSVALKSAMPLLSHFIHRQKPFMRKAIKLKDQMLERNIQASLKRIQADPRREREIKCAVDYILLREQAAAKKAGVQPHYNSPTIKDELFGYIVGGHDTTSTTLSWWLKFMAAQPAVQARLRRDIRAAFAQALSEHRQPTAAEIAKSHIPYLDAVVEETLRHSKTLPLIMRQATADTYILGHRIPKGTDVLFISHGPDFLSPAIPVDEEKRTKSSRHAKDRYGVWSEDDVALYRPERWLKTEKREDGVEQEVFDAQAGPQMAFGLGPRGCFGRRLAYLEMRIAVCLLLWNFEFGEMGEELNNMEVIDKLTTEPKDCYVRLKKVEY